MDSPPPPVGTPSPAVRPQQRTPSPSGRPSSGGTTAFLKLVSAGELEQVAAAVRVVVGRQARSECRAVAGEGETEPGL